MKREDGLRTCRICNRLVLALILLNICNLFTNLTYMTLISKEDVQKILNKKFNNDRWLDFIVEIKSLPTFHDPIAVLKEMIDNYNSMSEPEEWD